METHPSRLATQPRAGPLNPTLCRQIVPAYAPGESDSEFNETLEVFKKVSFNFAFMFKYSSRPGTKASEYSDQLSEDIKQERLATLIELQRDTTLLENKKSIGKTVNVLVEKESKKSSSQWSGRTEGNMWVVFDKNQSSIKDIVKIKIDSARGVTMFGNIINPLGKEENEAA